MPRSYLRYKEGPDLNLPPSPPSPLFVATPLHNIKLNKMVKERQKKKNYMNQPWSVYVFHSLHGQFSGFHFKYVS